MKYLALLVVFTALLIVPAASASSKFSGVTLTGPLDPVTLQPVNPAYGDMVVFDVEGVTADQFPWLTVSCTQKNTLVYRGGQNYYAPGISEQFTLASMGDNPPFWSAWPANTAASCTAKVEVLNQAEHKTVVSVDFGVSG